MGTSVIVNTVNSDAQRPIPPRATAPFQDYATFLVTGRLNLFQANSITGNTTDGPGPVAVPQPDHAHDVGPGRHVRHFARRPSDRADRQRAGGRQRDQLHDLRHRRSRSTSAASEGQLDAKISNFYIGGQTDNVLLVAPSGSRNISFGLGMDNVTINSLAISSLTANRDATQFAGHRQPVDRQPVDRRRRQSDTNVNVGADSESVHVRQYAADVAFGEPVTASSMAICRRRWPIRKPIRSASIQEPIAQNGGTMNVRIAGNVTNSVFSASVDGNPSQSTSLAPLIGPQSGNLMLPRGVINAKVEGKIDNSANSLVTDPNQAFYAKVVHLSMVRSFRRCAVCPVQGADGLSQGPGFPEGIVQD